MTKHLLIRTSKKQPQVPSTAALAKCASAFAQDDNIFFIVSETTLIQDFSFGVKKTLVDVEADALG
jgi:hypothetical protein